MVWKNWTPAFGFAVLAGGLSLMLAGCASPGSPMPPSLKLPQVPTDVTATRVGGQVVLRWTTSARTTDRALLTGTVTAEVCRDTVGSGSQAAGAAPRQGRRSGHGCNVVARAQVGPGASEASDALPPAMTTGAPVVLAYRVQLLNAAGRTAGPSQVVYAAAGAAPEAVTGVRASSTKPGVVLEWAHVTGGSADSVELDRVLESADSAAKTPAAKKDVALLGGGESAESRFSARNTGGAIDRTAKAGETYRYTVQRVRAVPFQGKSLEIRSEPSAAVEVSVKTVFPPDVPSGLIAAPANSELGKPAIDLSWEPNVEVRIAGYKVYRRTSAEPWRLLTPDAVTVAAYRDTAVTPGERYTYRVTAVNDAGMESAPSAEVQQGAAER